MRRGAGGKPPPGAGGSGPSGLEAYRRKRRFQETPEPPGKVRPRGGGDLFVIQRHAARRLHYDFRLELGGVLLSWAVPKGPCLDPRERRLAVRVEDHPIEYGSFEGTIPEGEYGAGTVLLWDRGRWIPAGDPREGLREGKLKFSLEGEKLRGGWMLVRLGGAGSRPEGGKEEWLLIKERDVAAKPLEEGDILDERPESVARRRRRERTWRSGRPAAARRGKGILAGKAVPVAMPAPAPRGGLGPRRDLRSVPGVREAPLPRWIEPQLSTLAKSPPEGDGWLHEVKLDGYRLVLRIGGGAASILSRQGKDWTDRLPHIARAARELPIASAVIDGEAVVLDDRGVSDFGALQAALGGAPEAILYYAFDLLHLDGLDLREAALADRKEILASIIGGEGPIRFADAIEGKGRDFFREACRYEVEGIVSKRKDRPYRPGRSRDWVKTKCLRGQELVIGGYLPRRDEESALGALLVGHRDAGGRLRYAGRVGTGFDARTAAALLGRLRTLERDGPPFADPPKGAAGRTARWVEPRLVAEVAFAEWTAAGRLRHPRFKGLREDRDPAEVVREEPRDPAPATPACTAAVGGIAVTNPGRIIDASRGFTKLDVARHYERAAARMLPHLEGRLLTLVRCPRGLEGRCFYQKRIPRGLPEAVRRREVQESDGERDAYPWIRDLPGLIALIQAGTLEIHPWGSREDDLERPDRLVLDLDPSPEVPWGAVVAAARYLRDRLAGLGLVSFPKSTGGKGLHIVAPLEPRGGWDEVRSLAAALAGELVRAEPAMFIDRATLSARKGKIYIDALRNVRGATSVAPYSLRTRPGLPVSAPLRWDELSPSVRPVFDIETMIRRLAGEDPWEGFFEVRQRIGGRGK